MLVTDIPIWEDCQFRDRVPARYEIRRLTGTVQGTEHCFIWDDKGQAYVTFELPSEISDDFDERYLKPALGSLGGFVFEKSHPGGVQKLINAETFAAVHGRELEEEFKGWREELDSLSNPLPV